MLRLRRCRPFSLPDSQRAGNTGSLFCLLPSLAHIGPPGCAGIAGKLLQIQFESSATVELAARAVGCEPARIAKTLSFKVGEDPILIVAAGDAKIDNRKYKDEFGAKAKMLSPKEAESRTGHAKIYSDCQ